MSALRAPCRPLCCGMSASASATACRPPLAPAAPSSCSADDGAAELCSRSWLATLLPSPTADVLASEKMVDRAGGLSCALCLGFCPVWRGCSSVPACWLPALVEVNSVLLPASAGPTFCAACSLQEQAAGRQLHRLRNEAVK